MLMLIVSAVAASALWGAAVAQANGPEWYVGGEKLEHSMETEFEGELRFQGPFGMGPCEVRLEGVLENKSGHAAGLITGGEVLTHPCATTLAGCTIEAGLYDFYWNISADATGVSIANTKFVNTWSEYCRLLYGFPETWTWGGTLKTPTFNNAEGCLEYENAGNLAQIPNGYKVTTTGMLCAYNMEGEGSITLK